MKSIKFRITGTCPLMLNNPQTVNPMNEFSKALKELTSKRTKTDVSNEQESHHQPISNYGKTEDTPRLRTGIAPHD